MGRKEVSKRPRVGTYYCPQGHQDTCAGAFAKRDYTRIYVDRSTYGFDAIVEDARKASVCWLPGWPEQEFSANGDYDTVSVDDWSLMISPEAVTNLRSNISDRNLWDKALLCEAMGPREWLPFTVVRDVRRNGGLFGLGLGPDVSDEVVCEEHLDPFDKVYVEVIVTRLVR